MISTLIWRPIGFQKHRARRFFAIGRQRVLTASRRRKMVKWLRPPSSQEHFPILLLKGVNCSNVRAMSILPQPFSAIELFILKTTTMTSKLRAKPDDQLFHPEQSSTGYNCIERAKLSM